MARKKKSQEAPQEQQEKAPPSPDAGQPAQPKKAKKKAAQPKIQPKEPDFHEVFMSRVDWLGNVVPLRIDCRRALLPYMDGMADAMRLLARTACSGKAEGNAEHLPWLACVILAFLDAQERTGRTNGTVNAICALAVALHNAQHMGWGDSSWDRLIFHQSDLDRDVALSFFRRERDEALETYRKRRVEKAGAAALRHHLACMSFACAGGAPPEPDPYVDEIPRRECPVCGRAAWPTPEASFDEERGRRFFCPFCGHSYGWQGMRRQIRNADGTRKDSTAWTADRMGIDRCQICGKHLDELKAEGGFLSAHHLKSVSKGGLDVPSNILIVCWDCHREIHRRRGDLPPVKS